MRSLNVLIASAGRRVFLVKTFAEAVHKRGGIVVAADIDRLAPALYIADRAVRVPPVQDKAYIEILLEIVNQYHISLLVPTIDPELLKLAENRKRFAQYGCMALVSSPDLVRITRDKWLMITQFSAMGFDVPKTWLPDTICLTELPQELFVKPRYGSASQHTYRVSRDRVFDILALVPNPIIQEYLRGPELTVDAFLDFSGRPIHYVVRRRIKTIGGESVEGVTLSPGMFHDYLVNVLLAIGKLGGIGPVTLQFFLEKRGLVLSEINPRFGGGFPLAWFAGARYPEWILNLLEGESLEPRLGDYKVGIYMTRYYMEIFQDKPLWE